MKSHNYWKSGSFVVIILILLNGFFTNSTNINTSDADFINETITSRASCEVQSILADDPIYPFDVWIDAGYYYVGSGSRDEGTPMYGSFTASPDIDFFICDEANYNLWRTSQPASVYLLSQNVRNMDWKFLLPSTDTWHLVYDNSNGLSQAHVTGFRSYDGSFPEISWNLIDGNTYSGTIIISITASDDGFGVDDIQLKIDGSLVDQTNADTLTYSWDTTEISDGAVTVKVEVRDEIGWFNSLEVTVTIDNVTDFPASFSILGIGSLVLIGVVFVIYYKMKSTNG